jgi:hypothetical protein
MPGGELHAPAPLAGFIIRYGLSYSAFGVASPFLPSFIVAAEVEVLFLIKPWLLSVLTPAARLRRRTGKCSRWLVAALIADSRH